LVEQLDYPIFAVQLDEIRRHWTSISLSGIIAPFYRRETNGIFVI